MTYHPLTEDDVFELFRTVTANSSLPVVVYVQKEHEFLEMVPGEQVLVSWHEAPCSRNAVRGFVV